MLTQPAPRYQCDHCGWVPPFPIESDDDWADMLAVHEVVMLEDAADDHPRSP